MNKEQVLKVSVITLGCAKNTVDSEKIVGLLAAEGVQARHVDYEDGKTDVVIVNTCGFINDAKQESIDTIFDYIEAKKRGTVKKLIVMGCLSERYKKELTEEMPEVDGFYGVTDFKEIVTSLVEMADVDDVTARVLSTPSHYAFLKIAEGCNHKCSFCAIPDIRGRFISRPVTELMTEARELANRGVKELIVIAQDITYYGYDLEKQRTLAQLVEQLTTIEGIEWVRLQYAYPWQFPMDLLEVMANNPKVVKYMDIPFQHINDRILKSMRRRIDAKGTYDLIHAFREKVPDMALRTSLIVGYPGETEEEFEELVEFVQKVQFDRLGVFTYSHEENTYAYELEDDIPEEVKQARMEKIMELQQDIAYNKNQALVGTKQKVLVDRKEGEVFIGRTQYDSPEVDNEVVIEDSGDIVIGEFVEVEIESGEFYDLFGTKI